MQESAQAAMSYIRSRALQFGLPRDFYRNLDIHLHYPGRRHPEGWAVGGHHHGDHDRSALTGLRYAATWP